MQLIYIICSPCAPLGLPGGDQRMALSAAPRGYRKVIIMYNLAYDQAKEILSDAEVTLSSPNLACLRPFRSLWRPISPRPPSPSTASTTSSTAATASSKSTTRAWEWTPSPSSLSRKPAPISAQGARGARVRASATGFTPSTLIAADGH